AVRVAVPVAVRAIERDRSARTQETFEPVYSGNSGISPGKKAKRMPTTSDIARTTETTIRSPSGRTVATPRPVDHAMSHDNTSDAHATTTAAKIRRHRARLTSHTNAALHNIVTATCSTTPLNTRPTSPPLGVR